MSEADQLLAWVFGSTALWYVLAGAALRTRWLRPTGDSDTKMTIWLLSPLVLLIGVVCLLGTLAWVLSCGATDPPWRWTSTPDDSGCM